MYWPFTWRKTAGERRASDRFDIRCPAGIRVGERRYAGYIDNISEAGARLRTVGRLCKLGPVSLQLPGLPGLTGHVRWSDSHDAGVRFDTALSKPQLARWIRRSLGLAEDVHSEFSQLLHLPECRAQPIRGKAPDALAGAASECE